MVTVVAITYARAGQLDKAMDELEFALSIPNFVSIPWIRVDPLFDPLREHPRFKALIAQESQPEL